MIDPTHNFYSFVQKSGNTLLVKDDIGKPKPSTRKLPSEHFTYGKPNPLDTEGAGKVISSWQEHSVSKTQPADRDFKKLNSMSVTQGCTKAPQVRNFRMTNDFRIKSKSERNKSMSCVKDETLRYGRPSRPSTPIHAVVGHFYTQVADEIQNEAYARKNTNVSERSLNEPRTTKGFDLFKQAVKNSLIKPVISEFKIEKFQNVAPRTQSYSKNPHETFMKRPDYNKTKNS